jgi:hypothetical protein
VIKNRGGKLGTNSICPLCGNANIYNNTFYTPPQVTALALAAWFKSAATAAITFQNNIVQYETYYNNQGGPFGCLSLGSAGYTAPSVNNNFYGAGMTFGNAGAVANLAAWQALGFDKNSISGASPFAATPAAMVLSSFAITGPALTSGIGGKPIGALDGSGAVGCNFS